jgi:hypothetical protein
MLELKQEEKADQRGAGDDEEGKPLDEEEEKMKN